MSDNFIRAAFQASGKMLESASGGVNEKEAALILTTGDLKTARIKALSEKTGIPVRTVERLVSSLKNLGIFAFLGAPKTGGYTLTNEGLEILKDIFNVSA